MNTTDAAGFFHQSAFYFRRLLFAALIAFLFATPVARAVDGVIPNLSYPTNQLFKQISPQLSNRHLNQPSVFNGYLMLAGNAVHEVWDIANPYAPVQKATLTSPFASGEAESHQVTYGKTTNGTAYFATTSGKGVDIWNVTVTTNPVLVAAVQLPNINYGDVANAIWGLSWQGNYLYLGATTMGLYIVDVSNPAQPQLVKTFTQAQLGGVVAGPLFALGNLLVITTPKGYSGVATVDISNPTEPMLLDSVTGGSDSYIGGFYGGNAHLITPLRTYDVTTDPRNIQLLASVAIPASEYVSFADNFLFLGGLRGGTEGIYKYSITNPASPTLIGRFVGRNTLWDDQFSCPIGNLIAVADDQFVNNQYVGGLLAVHDMNPDTKPPTVLKVVPKDGTVNQLVTTRVGFSMSEWIELATVNASTLIVRPVGGQAVAGAWSLTCSTLNFSPAAPLLPNTTYEVILPAGGVRDFVGNAIANEFHSTFRTGSGVGGFPGNLQVAPVSPTQLGDPTDLGIAHAPIQGVLYSWAFGDGTTNTGAAVTHTYGAPGRYAVILRGTHQTTIFEAESAQFNGGVSFANNNAGFTGTGFADFPAGTGTNVYVRWQVTAQSAINANLTFRYANGDSIVRPLNLVINGGAQILINLPGTGGWTGYGTVTYSNAVLAAGVNTIELQASAGQPGPNIDHLSVAFPDAQPLTTSFTHIVHRPLTAVSPTRSQPMALDAARRLIWVVNPDTDTVTAVNTTNLTKVGEYPVGDQPETIALAPDGTIWIVNHGSSTISVLNSNGATLKTIGLSGLMQPYGLAFTPNGSNAYVTFQSGVLGILSPTFRVLAAFDSVPTANGILAQLRGLAIDATGTNKFVTRFISPSGNGEVYRYTNSVSFPKTIPLANDPGPDSPLGARGVPNYLSAIAISPDGTRIWVPSKKDNLSRGQFRDGNPLNHDMTVRAITSVIDPITGVELLGERTDYDNRDRAHDVCFSPLGDLAFVTMPGNNHVQVVDTYSRASVTQLPTGKAPTGVLLDGASKRLYVLNFLSRSLSVFDVADLLNGVNNFAAPIGSPVSLVTTEALTPTVLRGKELFYDATSTRLNEEGYMSCASCHLDGGHDGRVWDLTSLGEGLRNTIDLRGRAGTAHGRLHWSGNFDEVQDFEGQIRALGSGTGLMDGAQFAQGTRAHPLGLAKHGISADLDALADYVASLNKFPASPYRNMDGSLTTNGVAGRILFNQLGCYQCHGGDAFTDSPQGGFHDVGTLKASSGQRLGGPLTGLDTPTLRGIWQTVPYLHDGSAPTLPDVLTTANPTNAHGTTSSLTATQLVQLVSYLNQIDGSEPAALPATGVGLPAYSNYVAKYSGLSQNPLASGDGDTLPNLLEYALGETNPTNASSVRPAVATMLPGTNGVPEFEFSYLRKTGGYWKDGAYRIADLEYTPAGSLDLLNWNLPLVESPNPPNLSAPPTGHEWVTYKPLGLTNNARGFGRVKVELK